MPNVADPREPTDRVSRRARFAAVEQLGPVERTLIVLIVFAVAVTAAIAIANP